jgi:hypothetical protein
MSTSSDDLKLEKELQPPVKFKEKTMEKSTIFNGRYIYILFMGFTFW